ncbi:MAG: Bug family tripartite tricarboxylate transporter substrate binding protein [Burkholderiales bacterium]
MTCKLVAVLAMTLSLLAAEAIAQSYPTRPVTLVVPFPAGGRTDLTARVVAQFLKTELGQPVVVVNKPGASGVLGAKEVAGAGPDGYTLGVFSTGFLTTQYTVPTPTNAREYEFIALINMDPAAVAVPVARGWKSLEELVASGRANPDKLRVGTNPGSSAHVFAAAFAKAANLEVVYVPFKGGGERTSALAGGHIDVDFDIVAPLRPMVEAGKVRILAVAAERRVELYRNIATMREQGVDLVISSWHGVFAPRGTPPAVIATVSTALEKVARNREFVEHMNKLLLGVHYLGSQDFARFFAREDEVFKALIEKLGLHVAPKTAR